MITISANCQRGIHQKCPRKLGSGRFCECGCHAAVNEANRKSIHRMAAAIEKRNAGKKV